MYLRYQSGVDYLPGDSKGGRVAEEYIDISSRYMITDANECNLFLHGRKAILDYLFPKENELFGWMKQNAYGEGMALLMFLSFTDNKYFTNFLRGVQTFEVRKR